MPNTSSSSAAAVEMDLLRFSAAEPHGDLALTGDVRRAPIGRGVFEGSLPRPPQGMYRVWMMQPTLVKPRVGYAGIIRHG